MTNSLLDAIWWKKDEWEDNRLPHSGSFKEAAEELQQVFDNHEAAVYEYDEIEHDRSGKMVPCRECMAMNFLTHVTHYGCHECDAEPRDVVIKAKSNNE